QYSVSVVQFRDEFQLAKRFAGSGLSAAPDRLIFGRPADPNRSVKALIDPDPPWVLIEEVGQVDQGRARPIHRQEDIAHSVLLQQGATACVGLEHVEVIEEELIGINVEQIEEERWLAGEAPLQVRRVFVVVEQVSAERMLLEEADAAVAQRV